MLEMDAGHGMRLDSPCVYGLCALPKRGVELEGRKHVCWETEIREEYSSSVTMGLIRNLG